METSKPREPLTAEKKERFEGFTAAIFPLLGMNLSTLFPVGCPSCPEEKKTHVVECPIRFTGLCSRVVDWLAPAAR